MVTQLPPRPQTTPGLGLSDLSGLLGDHRIEPAGNPALTGVSLRAQHVRPGDLFAALPGNTVHGAAFVDDAIAAGAVAVLTDRRGLTAISAEGPPSVPVVVVDDPRSVLGAVSAAVYGDPSARIPVIGVTGTSGKTTTCYLIEALLTRAGYRPGLIGTVQTRIDHEPVASSLTTPEAPDLQALFAVMAERGVTAVAMEVSSHALSLGRVAGTRFAVGAFTNLSQDHLDFHHDMEEYFAAKSLLFDGRAAAEVIGVDDEYGRRLAATHPGAQTASASGVPADWSVRSVEPGPAGTQDLALQTPTGVLTGRLSLPGAFNAANALMALACVRAAGIEVSDECAAAAFGSVVVPGRMERIDAGQPFLAVVDYAHKPAALTAVLQATARELPGRLIVVVGAGGDRDHGKRAQMGANAAAWADLVIVTDDNPRSEVPATIRAALLDGARGPVRRERPGAADVREIGDRAEAIRVAIGAAGPGDAVVIAGKGHEQGQEVAAVVHPFSDRAQVQSALAALGHQLGRRPGHGAGR